VIADDLAAAPCTRKGLYNLLIDELAAVGGNNGFALRSSTRAETHAQASNAAADLKTIVGTGTHKALVLSHHLQAISARAPCGETAAQIGQVSEMTRGKRILDVGR
jgi:hypothetical protein